MSISNSLLKSINMDISYVKGIALVLMFFVTFVCSSIPVCFVNYISHTDDSNRRSKYQFMLSCMSCVAGGVFMGTCILDLFPDVQEQIDILLSQYTISRPFPLAEFIVVFGFLLVLTIEQIVMDYKEKSYNLNSEGDSQNLLNTQNAIPEELDEHRLIGISDSFSAPCPRSVRNSLTSVNNRIQIGCDSTDNHHGDIHTDISSHSPFRSILLLFALSLHSVFEGMAVGLQSTIDNVVALFLVVILHKGTIALSLSINMVQSRLSVKQIMLANIFFCLTAPVGLAVGIGIMTLKNSVITTLLSGTLQGIACGTFLYVTFFEVLPHEMNSGGQRLVKLMFIILGFTIICSMLYIYPDSNKYHCYRS